MKATKNKNGNVTASASRAEGVADSSIHGLRRRSPSGRISDERPTGSVSKRFGSNSRSRRSPLPASQHQSGVERSTSKGRVRLRGLRKTSAPIVSGSRLQREAVLSGSMEEGVLVRHSGIIIAATPKSGPEHWRLGPRLDMEKVPSASPKPDDVWKRSTKARQYANFLPRPT